MNKKGLSPIIATAMLITLTLVLASIVFLWARGFISEQVQKFGQPIERQCDNIEWEVSVRLSSPANAKFFEVSNYGNIAISSINIKKVFGRNEETENYKLELGKGKADTITIDTIMTNGENAEKVIFYPVLIGDTKDGENKGYPCETQGKAVGLS